MQNKETQRSFLTLSLFVFCGYPLTLAVTLDLNPREFVLVYSDLIYKSPDKMHVVFGNEMGCSGFLLLRIAQKLFILRFTAHDHMEIFLNV